MGDSSLWKILVIALGVALGLMVFRSCHGAHAASNVNWPQKPAQDYNSLHVPGPCTPENCFFGLAVAQ